MWEDANLTPKARDEIICFLKKKFHYKRLQEDAAYARSCADQPEESKKNPDPKNKIKFTHSESCDINLSCSMSSFQNLVEGADNPALNANGATAVHENKISEKINDLKASYFITKIHGLDVSIPAELIDPRAV